MRLQIKQRTKKRTWKAKRRVALAQQRPEQYVTIVKISDPLVQRLAYQMLPPTAWRAKAEEGTEIWAFPVPSFEPPMSYRDTDGRALISMRTVREDSPEWQRIRPGA